MPALPPAPNVLKCSLNYNTQGSLKAGNRLFFEYSGGPPSVANCNTIATGISTAFSTDLAALMGPQIGLVEITVTDLTSDTSAEGSWTGSIPGTRSGEIVDLDTAVLQNFTIARRYRGGKPRTYWPFGCSADLNSDRNTWTSGYLSAHASGWAAFLAAVLAITGGGCTITNHVNVSYYSGFASVENPVTKRWRNIPTPRTGDAVVDGITGTTVSETIGVQKRRRFSLAA